MEYSDGGGRRRVDLISNTVLDILAGDDEDDGEAVGAGTEAVGCTSESEPARSFAAASSAPCPGISSDLEMPACTCRRAAGPPVTHGLARAAASRPGWLTDR